VDPSGKPYTTLHAYTGASPRLSTAIMSEYSESKPQITMDYLSPLPIFENPFYLPLPAFSPPLFWTPDHGPQFEEAFAWNA
jgi:hypothetical protein